VGEGASRPLGFSASDGFWELNFYKVRTVRY
jgi:hypothetical protein